MSMAAANLYAIFKAVLLISHDDSASQQCNHISRKYQGISNAKRNDLKEAQELQDVYPCGLYRTNDVRNMNMRCSYTNS